MSNPNQNDHLRLALRHLAWAAKHSTDRRTREFRDARRNAILHLKQCTELSLDEAEFAIDQALA